MALAQLIKTIRSDYNTSTVPFAAKVADWFAANPDIVVQSIGYNRPDLTYDGDSEILRVAYLQASGEAAGCTWQATLYQTDGTLTAQDRFNAAYETPGALPVLPIFILDITDHERSRTGPESLLVIGIRTDVGPDGLLGYDRAVFIANPNAPIASGATGDATLLDASGATVSLAFPIMNVGAVSWPANQRNYVVYDDLTGLYIGLPSCCGNSIWAPPDETTTTSFPCPANFYEPNPTTVTNQPTVTSSTSTTSSTTSTSTTTTTTLSTTSTTTISTSSTSTTTLDPTGLSFLEINNPNAFTVTVGEAGQVVQNVASVGTGDIESPGVDSGGNTDVTFV